MEGIESETVKVRLVDAAGDNEGPCFDIVKSGDYALFKDEHGRCVGSLSSVALEGVLNRVKEMWFGSDFD